jgi:hypothetical protein
MSARLTPTRDHLVWPFLGPEHRVFAVELDAFAASGGAIAGVMVIKAVNGGDCAAVTRLTFLCS